MKKLIERTNTFLSTFEKMKDDDSDKFFQWILISFLTIVYLSVFSLTLILINNFTISSNNSYAISLQSRFAFGTQPSSLVIPVAFVLTIPFFYLWRFINSSNQRRKLASTYLNLTLAPHIICYLVTFKFLLGTLSFEALTMGAKTAVLSSLTGSPFTIFIIIPLTFIAAIPLTRYVSENQNFVTNKLVSVRTYSWILLISSYSSYYFAFTAFTKNSSTVEIILFVFLFLNFITYLHFATPDRFPVVKKGFLAIVLAIDLGIFIRVHVPAFFGTFEPNFTIDKINFFRINLLILVCSVLLAIGIVLTKYYRHYILTIIAGLLYLGTISIAHVSYTALDLFDGGELFGNWFETKNLHLTPFKDIEYPRGLLSNYLPASFAHYFTYGHADMFAIFFIFLALILGMGFYLVMSRYLKPTWIFFLLLLLPIPNSSWEIDFSFFIIFLFFVQNYQSHRFAKYLLVAIPSVELIFILAAPGQALVIGVPMFGVWLATAFTLYKQKSFFYPSLIITAVTFLSFLYLVRTQIFYGVRWALLDAPWNNIAFGDGWPFRLLNHEEIPIIFRFFGFLLAPVILYILVFKRSTLRSPEILLLVLGLIYILTISGRWYGRADSNFISRIGYGVIIVCTFILLPVASNFKNAYKLNSLFVITFAIVSSLSISQSAVADFSNPSLPTTVSQTYPVQSQYFTFGNQLSEIRSVELAFINSGKPSIFNMSGGLGASYYTGIPTVGGIESAYTVTNKVQIHDWLKRLETSNPQLVYGDYGLMGLGVIDYSNFTSRAPEVFHWLATNYIPFRCNNLGYAYKIGSLDNALRTKLAGLGCTFPSNDQQILTNWRSMDGTQSDIGRSLQTWAPSKNLIKPINQNSILIPPTEVGEPITTGITCSSISNLQLLLSGVGRDGSTLSTAFTASVRSGVVTLKPTIFPIASLIQGDLKLSIVSTQCHFQ